MRGLAITTAIAGALALASSALAQSPVSQPAYRVVVDRLGGPIVMANAYGDTAWFWHEKLETTQLLYWTPGGQRTGPPQFHIGSAAISVGTPIAVVLSPSLRLLTIRAVIDSLRKGDGRLQSAVFPDPSKAMCWYEPARVGPVDNPMAFSWDLKADASLDSTFRVIFLVVGRPDTTDRATGLRTFKHEEWFYHRSASDPTPVRADLHLRPYQVSPADMASTARVIGEVLIDLRQRGVVPLSPTLDPGLAPNPYRR